MGPGHPGQLGLDLGQSLEEGPVGREGRPRFERGYVPGTADHGDVVPELLAGRAQLDAHVRLADRVPGVAAVPVHLAQGGHRLAERGEGGQRVAGAPVVGAVFDYVLPPALGVVVARGLGQHPDGVDRDGRGARLPGPFRRARVLLLLLPLPLPLLLLLRHGQRVGGREVDEADRDVVREGPADRDPFGREPGEWPERRPAGIVHRVGEQCDGRPHLLVGGERQQRVALGRALDEHRPGPGGLQRGADGTGRAGAVVPHPQQQRTAGAGGAGPRDAGARGAGHAEASRQAR